LDVIGVDHFGASAPDKVVLEKYGFNLDHVCQQARALLQRQTR
jgi:transketolase